MNIAEKILRAKADLDNAFEAGKAQNDNDAFWEVFQNGGNPTTYYWAFSYGRWNDANYNPKFPIVGTSNLYSLANTFYNSDISDTKVTIDTSKTASISGIFYNASSLVTVRKLIMTEKITNTNIAFEGCGALKNITIEGNIACDLDIHWSPLTKESITSIILHLSDTASNKTLSLSGSAKKAAFTDEEWNSLVSLKPNWTISLM